MKNNGTHERHEEFCIAMILAAVRKPALAKVRGTFRAEGAELAVNQLVKAGCNRALLLDSVAFAVALPNLCVRPSAGEIKSIAKAGTTFISTIYKYFPPVHFEVESQDGQIQDLGPMSDFHISEPTKRELLHVVLAAKVFAKIVQGGQQFPTLRDIAQIASVWPAFYVAKATGQPHYEDVLNLLGATETLGRHDASSLAKAVRDVRNKVPHAENWLLAVLPKLPSEPSRETR